MKLNELYQYVKTGKLRTELILKYKYIHEIAIKRIEDGSSINDFLGIKDLVRLFLSEEPEENTDIFRIICGTVEREILQIMEAGKLWSLFNNCYYVCLIYRDDEGNLRSAKIDDVPGLYTEVIPNETGNK